MLIRDAVATDDASLLSIVNEVILTSTAIYRDDPETINERRAWRQGRIIAGYPILVAEINGEVAGFASFGDFRAWPGYRYTVEHSVHIRRDFRRRGIGSALVAALLPRAKTLGKHVMIAGIDADNAGSIRMHERLGFTQVAHFREVGFKFGRYLDLAFLQRSLT